jgi:hypothetical protein
MAWISRADIDRWFTYHSPEAMQVKALTAIRNKARELAVLIRESTPNCADQSEAIRRVREAVMTANAAIMCAKEVETLDAPEPKPVTMSTRAVGVTHHNSDGASRQELISRYCNAGIELRAICEVDNPWDPNAIGLWVLDACGVLEQVGFLASAVAKDLREIYGFGLGNDPKVKVIKTTGGVKGLSYGLELLIELPSRQPVQTLDD